IHEVHRHRYEVNNHYCQSLEAAGFLITAKQAQQDLVEGCEWQGHPFGLGIQAHPEFHSRPVGAHPLFLGFIRSAQNHSGC
ncbi:MAG: hypothetical protein AAF975_09420, partial [Spirochaetota bacterium]